MTFEGSPALPALDRLAGGLALDQLAQCELVLVLELGGIKVAGFGVEDVARRG